MYGLFTPIAALIAKRDAYLTQHSLRFDGSADYLTQTQGAGDTQKMTFSAWLKAEDVGWVFSAYLSPVIDGAFDVLTYNGGLQARFGVNGNTYNRSSNVSGGAFSENEWHHVVWSVDSTSADRVKIYVDGAEVSAYRTENSGALPLNYNTTAINNSGATVTIADLANYEGTTYQFGGQLAEVHFIDGTAYDASYFGETRGGVWLPKEVTGVTYGNNGFYLDFADSSTAADLGNDVSGNGNDFSVNGNITADDQLIDTPNLRFATWDPSTGGSTNTYREGNLLVDIGSTPDEAVSTMGVSSGKIYAEYYWKQGTYFFPKIAIGTSDAVSDYSGFWSNDGNKYDVPTGSTSYGSSFSVGSIISVAVDADTGTVWWAVDGSWQGGATVSEIEAGTTTNAAKTGLSGTLYVRADDGSGDDWSTEVVINFGQDHTFAGEKSALTNPYSDANGVGEFYYQPPSGFLALATEYK